MTTVTYICTVGLMDRRLFYRVYSLKQAEGREVDNRVRRSGELFEKHFCRAGRLLDIGCGHGEIARYLGKPLGVCVLTTPNLAAWYNRVALLLGYQPFHTAVSLQGTYGRPQFAPSFGVVGGHIRVFTFRALAEILKNHAFQVLEMQGSRLHIPQEIRLPGYMKVLLDVDWILGRFPSLAGGVIVAARKPR